LRLRHQFASRHSPARPTPPRLVGARGMEYPQTLDDFRGDGGEQTPGMCSAELWGGPWEHEAVGGDVSVHAANASTAAYHADVAAKHAASLAQWVQYLSAALGHLQGKVTELEEWKGQALVETRRLREEHRILRQRVLEEEAAASPTQRGGSSDEEALATPPGLVARSSADDKDAAAASNSPSESPQKLVSPSCSSSAFSIPSVPSASSVTEMDALGKDEGVQVTSAALDGLECERAVWRIGHLSMKLRGCMGRALVSSPFRTLGLDDVRLMVCPDGKDPAPGKNRRQKELYTKRITEGPLDASLKLKIPNCPSPCEIRYYLTVGSARRGPFIHNFSETTVSECGDFGDWLGQLDEDKSLTISLEAFPLPSAVLGAEDRGAGLEPSAVYSSLRDIGPLQ